MKIINQSYEILELPNNGISMIELAGRTCYKSEGKITKDSSAKFVKMLRNKGHHAMIEFGIIMVRFVTNRGVTHELVRHRHCSFAQESTRYVKYDGEMEFIMPVWMGKSVLGLWEPGRYHSEILNPAEKTWLMSMERDELDYKICLKNGWKAQQAREVLPNSLKTEIVVMANIREWRHILTLRCSKAAHPQMRALMIPLLKELQEKLPVVFDDIGE